jgi:anti-sigma factor RsiW
MMDIDPNDAFAELLSAYLDGELSDAERLRVEERLAEDPAAQAMLDELRQTSSALQGMPRETLGRDLLSAVWKDVDERAAGKPEDERATIAMRDASAARAKRAGRRRGLAWAAAAIAAALLMAAFLPRDDDGRELAAVKKPEQPRPSEPMVAGRVASEAPAQADEESLARDGDSGEKSDALRAAGAPHEIESRSSAHGAAAIGEATGGARRVADSAAEGRPATSNAARHRSASASDAFWQAGASRTVNIQLSNSAGAQLFEQLLASNNIELVDADVEADELAEPPAPETAATSDASGARSGVELAETPPSEGGLGGRESVAARSAGKLERELAGPDQVAAVLVEATPQQIDQLVQACQADARNFALVETPPAVDEESEAVARTLSEPASEMAAEDKSKDSPDGAAEDRSRSLNEQGWGYSSTAPAAADGAVPQENLRGRQQDFYSLNRNYAQGRALRLYVPRSYASVKNQGQLQTVVQQVVDRSDVAQLGVKLALTKPALAAKAAVAAPSGAEREQDQQQVRVLFVIDAARAPGDETPAAAAPAPTDGP